MVDQINMQHRLGSSSIVAQHSANSIQVNQRPFLIFHHSNWLSLCRAQGANTGLKWNIGWIWCAFECLAKWFKTGICLYGPFLKLSLQSRNLWLSVKCSTVQKFWAALNDDESIPFRLLFVVFFWSMWSRDAIFFTRWKFFPCPPRTLKHNNI